MGHMPVILKKWLPYHIPTLGLRFAEGVVLNHTAVCKSVTEDTWPTLRWRLPLPLGGPELEL
jgi:hypothetical protein